VNTPVWLNDQVTTGPYRVGPPLCLVIGAFVGLVGSAHAQRLPPVVAGVAPPSMDAPLMVACLPIDARQRQTHSTFMARSLWGLGGGILAALVASAVSGEGGASDAVTTASYVGGTVLGVVLVTRAHEGVRPLGTVVGALAGAAVGVGFAFGVCQLSYDSLDDPGACSPSAAIAAGFTFLIATPVGASIGHSVDAKRHGR
jgi:hypothetical protein